MGGKQANKGRSKRSRHVRDDDEFTMLIDDFGDPGKNTKRSEAFGFGISVTDRADDLTEIARWFKPEDKDELKFRELNDKERNKVIKEISYLKPETYATYIDKRKRDHPRIWNNRDRSETYREVLKESVKEALKETEKDDFLVVMDRNTSLKDLGRITVNNAAIEASEETGSPMKNIKSYMEVDSVKCDMMQAHDAVAGAAYAAASSGNAGWAARLKMKITRLKR